MSCALHWRRDYPCLSGATTAVPGGMFHHDLQNHLSLWHDAAGLIVGGGNSLYEPVFSTFRFGTLYLADKGSVSMQNGTAVLDLSYRDIRAKVEVAFEGARSVRIRASTRGLLPDDSDFAIHLPSRHGGVFRNSRGETPMDDRGIWSGFGGDSGDGETGPLKLQSQTFWLALWPIIPFNIYDVPRRLPLESAVLRIVAKLKGEAVEMRISLRG